MSIRKKSIMQNNYCTYFFKIVEFNFKNSKYYIVHSISKNGFY